MCYPRLLIANNIIKTFYGEFKYTRVAKRIIDYCIIHIGNDVINLKMQSRRNALLSLLA